MGHSASIGLPGQNLSAAAAVRKPSACPLCGSQDAAPRFRQGAHTLMRCAECDLSFIWPFPDSKQHHAAVSEYDYPDLEVLRCATQYQNERLFYERYFEAIELECRGASSILDVGCGCGHLLERLSALPELERAGIELNRQRAEFARNVARCEVLEVPIEEIDSARRFDVITLINVLSHVPDLRRLFEKLRALLAERGKVIVKTGELQHHVRRSAVYDWEFPDHLHFLGWRTMQYIAQKHGLEIVKHQRKRLSEERFASSTWRMQGRSGVRNGFKRGIARLPFALPFLARCYDVVHRGSVSSSFIVLRAE